MNSVLLIFNHKSSPMSAIYGLRARYQRDVSSQDFPRRPFAVKAGGCLS